MKTIKLTKNYYALVDEEDFKKVNKINWYATEKRDKVYANTKNSKLQISMHRYILNIKDTKLYIDHINGNGLDNRKINLRLCSNSQNLANAPKSKNNISGYKGVVKVKRNYQLKNPFISSITKNGKAYHLGYFETAELAAAAYNKKAIELFEEFANINKIQEN